MLYARKSSTSFSVTFGVKAGYDSRPQSPYVINLVDEEVMNSIKARIAVVSAWTAAMEEESDVALVTAVANVSRAVYPQRMGCPPEGELTVTMSGTRNPDYCPREAEYVNALIRIVERVKQSLDQRRVTLTIWGEAGVEFLYFTD